MSAAPSRAVLAAALLAIAVAGCGKAVGTPALNSTAAMQAQARTKGGTFTKETYQGRTYKVFAPAGVTAKAPLVVMLHGCTQDPDDFAKGTRMNALAAKEGFYVLYPLQTRQDHPMACFPWYERVERDGGMGGLVVGMIRETGEKHAIDANRVYVAGLSAGAAFAVNLAAVYPDVFAGVGVAAGLEFEAATNEMAARMAMMMGGPSAKGQGKKAFDAMGKHARPMPVIVFGGSMDFVVAQANATQVVEQWATTNDLADDGKANGSVDATADQTQRQQVPGGRTYTRTVFEDANKKPLMERVAVDMMGHAWSGGDKDGSYTDPKGPDATAMMWAFFSSHKKGK